LDANQTPIIHPKTPEAAWYHEHRYLPKVVKKLTEADELPFSVFFCGPQESNNPVTKKREDIAHSLGEMKGMDIVLGEEFCHDIKKIEKEQNHPIAPDNVYEQAAAQKADLVVILRSSYGSVAEMHEFLAQPQIAHKTWVFADKVHDNGYSSNGWLKLHENAEGKVRYFKSPDDIDQCHLKTQVIEIVQNSRIRKWYYSQYAKGVN
jgi:hypothetical protein